MVRSLPLQWFICLCLLSCYESSKCLEHRHTAFLDSTTLASMCTRHFQTRIDDNHTPSKIRNKAVYALLPQNNPRAKPETISASGVRYESVFNGLSILYPPNDLDQRNALSRTEGYWPFIKTGTKPPEELTYGEFDFYFFAELIDRAIVLSDNQQLDNNRPIIPNKVFCDIGSGSGRLVIAAASLHSNWQLCRGVELLQGIHDVAVENLNRCKRPEYNEQASFDEPTLTHALPITDENFCPMSPVEFTCGSFDDPYMYFGDSDIVFIFSSCMGSELVQDGLVKAIGRQCKPGTIVITTDYMLPLEGFIAPHSRDNRIPSGNFRLRLLESIDGWCWLTGGSSTAFIHLVESSLWEEGRGKIDPLELSLEDKALDVVHALESGKLTDSKAFLRNVRNIMIFNGFPESFLPKLKE